MSADEAESWFSCYIFKGEEFDVSLKNIAITNQSKPLAKLAKQAVNVA